MLHSFKQIFIENPGTVLCPGDVKADGHCPQRVCTQKCKKCGECKEARIEIHIGNQQGRHLNPIWAVGGSDSEGCRAPDAGIKSCRRREG